MVVIMVVMKDKQMVVLLVELRDDHLVGWMDISMVVN